MKHILIALLLLTAPAIAAPICDGITDDTAAVKSAALAGDILPVGVCRVTADINITANGGYVSGAKIKGRGMLGGAQGGTTILADYNGNAALGAVIRFDTSAVGSYTVGSEVSDLLITQAPGRTGLNGLQLTAAWMFKAERVKITGMSGSGIIASLRSDINPISDYYQSFSVVLSQLWISGNSGWGINFSAGQSPGLYTLQYSIIASNAGGGIKTTTGQCLILANLIVANGAYGGQGGLLLDTAEGPSMVGEVRQNEFDTNFSWHVNLKRARGWLFSRNRFLTQTYASNTSGVLQSGSAFPRPYVHVNLGAGSANEVWSTVFEYNLHRSVTGAGPTTASVIAYTASGGSLSPSAPVQLLHNDLSGADGVTQNSASLTKFAGFSGTGAVIVDP
jgi:hypothetical protein